MRLICPNCGAQYEVPQSVIPEAGRDVQCSSCGHTWFQAHPDHDSARRDEADQTASDEMWDDEDDAEGDSIFEEAGADRPKPEVQGAQDGDRARAAQTSAPSPDPEEDTSEDEWEGFPKDPGLTDDMRPGTSLKPDPEDPAPRLPEVEDDDYEEDPANDLPQPRRSLDTSVADLLREEAEREARARAAERGPGLESQPDLGLDGDASQPVTPDSDAQRRSEEARLRMARLRGEDTETATAPQTVAKTPPPPPPPPAPKADTEDDRIAAAAAAAVADSRRALLPDIEEINSSLRSTSDRRPARADDYDTPGKSAESEQSDAEKPRGFSRGFSVTLLIAAILLALYVFAPALAEAVPAAAPVVDAYVSAVDALRVMLDAQFQKLSLWLEGIAGGTN